MVCATDDDVDMEGATDHRPLVAYRICFYPTERQRSLLVRTFGCIRKVWNDILEWRSTRWREHQQHTSYREASATLTWLKNTGTSHAFLNEVSSVPLQQALRHQQTAFTNFFRKRARHPRFKRKPTGTQGSAEFTKSGFRWNAAAGALRLALDDEPLDLRWSPTTKHQRAEGRGDTWRWRDDADPSTVTISCDACGRWWASVLVREDPYPIPAASLATAGYDAGFTDTVTASTGWSIAAPKPLSHHLDRLARLQRARSRHRKGSNRGIRLNRRIARLHARISDLRRQHLHHVADRIVRETQAPALEDLAVNGMCRGRMARAAHDVSLGTLRTYVAYRCARHGRTLRLMPRFERSTGCCPDCGHVGARLDLGVRSWTCPSCGRTHDRDHAAARWIDTHAVPATAVTARPAGSARRGTVSHRTTSSSGAGSDDPRTSQGRP